MKEYYNTNKTFIITVIIIFVVIIGVAIYYYRKGKKTTTIVDPNLLPDGSSGGTTGASNDELKNLANEMYKDMDGWNLNGWNVTIYNRALLLNDRDIAKLYNTFNAYYQKENGETLTQMINNERFKPSVLVLLELRLKKLNLV